MYHFLQMGSRHAIVAILLVGCGRFGFDSIDGDAQDAAPDAAPGTAISLDLPGGGTIRKLTSAPDGTWYALSERGQGYRSDDGQRWVACGDRQLTAIAVGGDSTVYGSGSDVAISTDRCATWISTVIDRFTDHVGTTGTDVLALADIGLRRRTGSSWTAIPTALDGGRFVAYAGRPGTARIAAVVNAGVVVSATGATWTAVTTGFPNFNFNRVAASRTRLYAITGAGAVPGGIACSTDGTGLTWTTCQAGGGLAIAVDPLNDLHVVAGIYDNLAETTDGFANVTANLRESVGLDAANIYDLYYLPSGDLLSASARGVFFSPAGPLAFQPRNTGLTAWNVYDILRDGDDVFLASEGGVLRSVSGATYTTSTTNMMFSTRVKRVVRAPDGSLIAVGRSVWRSVDQGQTFQVLNALNMPDRFSAEGVAFVGTRMYAGTNTRLVHADPPWTTWTEHVIGGGNRNIYAILPLGAELWLATSSGLYVSTDQAGTFTPVATITSSCRDLLALPDGTLVAACMDGAWFSDPARTTWQKRGPTGVAVQKLIAMDTTIVAATSSGLHATSDRGGVWTELAGSATVDAWALSSDDDGSIVYGGVGINLRRTTLP